MPATESVKSTTTTTATGFPKKNIAACPHINVNANAAENVTELAELKMILNPITTNNMQEITNRSAEYQELASKIDKLEKIALLSAKNVLTIDDVALITSYSKGHIYRLTSGKKIPHYKPDGRTLYFKKEEIEEWMLQNRIQTDAEIQRKATTYTAINKKNVNHG